MSRRGAPASLLAAALLLLAAAPRPAAALFGWGEDDVEEATRTITTYNTVTVRTAYALMALKGSFGNSSVRSEEVVLPSRGGAGKVTMYQALPSELVLVFSHPSLSTSTWAGTTRQVPFLRPFVYTSQAPAALLDAWQPLNDAGNSSTTPSTAGQLADALSEFMGGEEVLRVICVGEGAAGGLALLCGPWAAMHCPMANADVITFGTPWEGFNAQFAWSFEQLVVLHYMWQFPAPAVIGSGVLPAAQAVNGFVNEGSLPGAVRLPNLPPYAPVDQQDANGREFDDVWSSLQGSSLSLPEEYQMPESDCPVMFCKTRMLLKGSCLAFNNQTIFGDLPYRVLTDDSTNADAMVSWDEETKTAHFLFKYTEETRDWLTNANGIQREGFIEDCESIVANGVTTTNGDSLTKITGEVEVHSGFYNQFKSLAISPDRPEDDLLLQLSEINGGQLPRRVTCSGFSLGGALSELCGVWASIQWPGVDVLVANQGGPIPGNEQFRLAFEATVGRAYKYVYRMDMVPSTAPFAWYKRVPASVWINGTTAMLQDRPDWPLGALNWDDHTCDVWTNPEEGYTITGYVPRVYDVTRPTVPAWVFNYTAGAPAADAPAATPVATPAAGISAATGHRPTGWVLLALAAAPALASLMALL